MATDQRRLWEEFVHWAAQFSRMDENALGLDQIGRSELELDAAVTFFYNATFAAAGRQTISGGGFRQVKDTEVIVKGYRGAGVYSLTWTISGEVTTDSTWFIGAIPFIGKYTMSGAGDYIYSMAPYGVSYGANGVTPPTIPTDFMVNGDLFTISSHGTCVIDQDTPMYTGVMLATNRSGGAQIERAAFNLVKRRNM